MIIMIADDDAVVRKGIRRIIERSGLPVGDVIECGNGVEALNVILSEKPWLIITDIKMPGMDGIELLNRLHYMSYQPYIVIMSGYNEFEFAQKAMKYGAREYLLKPVKRDELIEVLHNSINAFQERKQDYSHIWSEHIRNSDHICTLLNKYGCLKIVYLQQCSQICPDRLKAAGLEFLAADNRKDIALVVSQDLDVYELHNKLKSEFGYSGSAGISRPFNSIYELGIMQAQAYEALKHRMLYPSFSIINFADVEKRSVCSLPYDKVNTLWELMGTGCNDKIHSIAAELLDAVKLKSLHISYAEELSRKLYSDIIEQYACNLSFNKKQYVRFSDIYSFNNIDEYCSDSISFIMNLGRELQNASEHMNIRNIVEQAIEFINDNYHRNLSMTVMANRFFVNYSYFSSIFKEITGLNYIDYIKQVRINKAKELLRSTDRRINSIAADVGYTDPKSFSKVFKAVVGISPNDYRDKFLVLCQSQKNRTNSFS